MDIVQQPQLPQELHNHILEYLRGDEYEASLKACAIAGRMLTGPSQRQLFAHVTVRWPSKCSPSLLRIGGSAPNFKKLLMSSPHLARYVECFQILDTQRSYVGPNMDLVHDAGTVEEWLSRDDSLVFCLPLLQNLKALIILYRNSLHGGRWNEVSPDFLSCLSQVLQLPSLVYFDGFEIPVLSLMKMAGPNLKIATIENVDDQPSLSPILFPTSSSPIFLESICISTFLDITTFLPSLAKEPRIRLSKLKKLEIHLEPEDYMNFSQIAIIHSSVAALLEQCSQALEEFIFEPVLDVASREGGLPDSYREPIDLSKLVSLRKLRVSIEVACRGHPPSVHSSFPWFALLLRSSDNQRLEDIHLSVTYITDLAFFGITMQDLHSWKEIGKILLSGRFPALKRLNISDVSTSPEMRIAPKLAATVFIRGLQAKGVTVLSKRSNRLYERASPNSDWKRWTDKPEFLEQIANE